MSPGFERKRERTPLNSEGDFYVEKDTCLWCMAPENEAPELMGFDRNVGCYFRRQPQTTDEMNHAVNAVRSSCVEALRYAGDDATILKRLRAKDCEHLCDVPAAGGDIEHVEAERRSLVSQLASFFQRLF